ncbi:hypothetical protein, conserved [Eimeria necatrix]|uniref:Uncharacterized protein n=1 Tax=Eimeria necatrix TaxID=51315 RepID=U6MVP2_9EIME|nr:hypothetical protein, conserved [Eimeria necatrix]CDJ66539.1 hypothetical protein, conserved [Eimeria necatrix]
MGVLEFQQLVESGQPSDAALRFWYLRFRFMNPLTPFEPHQEGDFAFGEFLSERLSEALLHMVEVPVSTWLLFVPLLLCLRPVFGFDPTPLTEFLVFAAGGLLLLNLFLFWRMETIMNYHTPSSGELREYLQALAQPRKAAQLPQAPLELLPPISRNGALCSFIRGAKVMNSQESLFILGPRGVPALRTCIQLSLSLHVVAVTATAKLLLSPHYQHVMFAVLGYWSGCAPLLILLLSLGLFPALAANFTLLSNVGSLASRQAVQASAHRVLLQQLERQYQILQFLRFRADTFFASHPGRAVGEIEEASQLYSSLPFEVQKGYQDVFHAFAKIDVEPTISLENIFKMIDAFALEERVPDCKAKAGELALPEPPSSSNMIMHLLEDETRASLPPHLQETQKRVGAIFFQLASWIDEMEDRAREFQPKGSSTR